MSRDPDRYAAKLRRNREYRDAHRDIIKKKAGEYRDAHRDEINQKAHERRVKTKTERLAKQISEPIFEIRTANLAS